MRNMWEIISLDGFQNVWQSPLEIVFWILNFSIVFQGKAHPPVRPVHTYMAIAYRRFLIE